MLTSRRPVDKQLIEGDRLYLIAESLAHDGSLFPAVSSGQGAVQGLLKDDAILRRCRALANMDVDSYIESVITPAEDSQRVSAPEIIRRLGRVRREEADGPYYSATIEMDFGGEIRPVGFIAQDRSVENGMWGPRHHRAAAERIAYHARRRTPIVNFMDTPGADSREDANRNNQAHSISRLIVEACNVDVPTVGVVYGLGYSGGAIPLAASNLLLAAKDGVFSTIQPRGLASIARRLNLSWQECAQYVGLSAYELYEQGNIDGVINFSAANADAEIENLRLAITTGILWVESQVKKFVSENEYIIEAYQQSLLRYLRPSERLREMQTNAALRVTKNPTEYLNIFGVAFRYMRYLSIRKRIKATTKAQYGRLATQELPQGELDKRADLERRQSFLKWLQDPDKVVYDDALSKAWKNYLDKREALNAERGRIAQFIFGEPKKNFDEARLSLITRVGVYLYNRWKSDAMGNLRALIELLEHHRDTRQILKVGEVQAPREFIEAIRLDGELYALMLRTFSHQGKKLLAGRGIEEMSDAYLSTQLTSELNLAMTTSRFLVSPEAGVSDLEANRRFLERRFPDFVLPHGEASPAENAAELSVLDVLVHDDLREDFIRECENLLLFDSVYDQVIANLDSIAAEAQRNQSLSRDSLGRLLNTTLELAAGGITLRARPGQGDGDVARTLRSQFLAWYQRVLKLPKGGDFFRSVEEWKRLSFPHLADALFVVVTYIFDALLSSYVQAEREGKAYQGKIAPRNIGRRKDFWNRLHIAYRDLQMQEVLRKYRRMPAITHKLIVERYFRRFEELDNDLISSDPRNFPGFRVSIEDALQKNQPPCGIVTGVGTFDDGNQGIPMGVVISNIGFQAGSFDMASAVKFCRLLVRCAQEHLPVVCFISSGGMQTKEGAGALFSMAAVNDRITRFVRDHDLPVIVFGFGDCTGGAQASFVTHPLVQTYYFSGTSMPFAGQIVTPSNLPLDSLLSNYLSTNRESMQGLVQHPFQPDLDAALSAVDPEIPLPSETVEEVVKRVWAGVFSQARPVVVAHVQQFTDRDLIRPVKKVLIHARGCTAVKLIRVAQRNGIAVVLVQSDPDMESTAADMLTDRDELVCIGGNTPDESYLNAQSVLKIAEDYGVDSLHPGIGFLSENAQFAELIRRHGINFIGPPVLSMETMGNKSNAISTSMKLGVPVVPGSHGILTSAERAADVADGIGYPVLIKAVHGGGGKGIQVVEKAADFHEQFHRVTREARSAFGNGDVYLEKYVTSLRHIEAQVLRDTHGNTRVLGIRDCSVQRDKQKVLEESESTALPEHLLQSVLDYTRRIADEVGYVGAGTVEFIYDLKADAVYFMEMNTRLQVEHPVTEWVSGVDIVGAQYRIASGESIADLEVGSNGYAIEARVTAERVQQVGQRLEFRPQPGQITTATFPEMDGVEVIAAAASGKFVSPYYDSMVAQIIVHAENRAAGLAKLDAYLAQVEVKGISTNIPLLRRVLKDPVLQAGSYDTSFLPEFLKRTDVPSLIAEIEASAGEGASAINMDAIRIEGSDELKVLSPATAIFYSTPSPSDPAYVSVDDVVDLSRTLCQLEAMKIFTPVKLQDFNTDAELYPAAKQYRVTRINVENGRQVNAGDLLFVVKPVG
ncbi:MAG: ATP-grasp domain-containing protein [Pseudomonadales bacterium]|nr:ATP-grasp domain-containing protein [Pseudomonadales bacterium]